MTFALHALNFSLMLSIISLFFIQTYYTDLHAFQVAQISIISNELTYE